MKTVSVTPQEKEAMLSNIRRLEIELEGGLEYVRKLLVKLEDLRTTTDDYADRLMGRLPPEPEEPEPPIGAGHPEGVRPTKDAPEMPGKRRRECSACNTKQYNIKNGLCEVCLALEE